MIEHFMRELSGMKEECLREIVRDPSAPSEKVVAAGRILSAMRSQGSMVEEDIAKQIVASVSEIARCRANERLCDLLQFDQRQIEEMKQVRLKLESGLATVITTLIRSMASK